MSFRTKMLGVTPKIRAPVYASDLPPLLPTCKSCCCFCFLCARARSWLLMFLPCALALFSRSRASSWFCCFNLLISIAR